MFYSRNFEQIELGKLGAHNIITETIGGKKFTDFICIIPNRNGFICYRNATSLQKTYRLCV